MQTSRMFQILYYLIANQTVTAGHLAEKLEVSTRTIYRDIERLSEAGIPVYSIAGRQGGLALVEGFTLDKVLLSHDERRTILSSLRSLDVTGEPGHEATLQKLNSLFGPMEEDWLEIDFSGWGPSELDNKKFELIKEAVIKCWVIQIAYCNSKGEEDTRTIEPLQLLYKAKAWYVKAYCRTNEGFRLFKLTRILRAKSLGGQFEKKSYPASDSKQSAPYTDIVLRFSRSMAYRVYDEFDSKYVCKEPAGSLLVCVSLPLDNWVVGYVLSFGSEVTVIEPDQLRQALLEQAKKIGDLYKS